jgi:disulfide bond formation protein DsbB
LAWQCGWSCIIYLDHRERGDHPAVGYLNASAALVLRAYFLSGLYLAGATLNLLVLVFILAAALTVQFMLHELPCPLCFLQRIAITLCAIGPLFLLAQNRRGPLKHCDIAIAGGMSLLAALVGSAISIRQILLHILPGDPGYGGTVLGIHLYTVCFWAFAGHALAAGIMLVTSGIAEPTDDAFVQRKWPLTNGLFLLFGLVLLINLGAVILEAGFHWFLPADPVRYLMLAPD